MSADTYMLQATRTEKNLDIRERFVWYAGPGRFTFDSREAFVFPTIADVQATARAIDARGGWAGYCNVAAVLA